MVAALPDFFESSLSWNEIIWTRWGIYRIPNQKLAILLTRVENVFDSGKSLFSDSGYERYLNSLIPFLDEKDSPDQKFGSSDKKIWNKIKRET